MIAERDWASHPLIITVAPTGAEVTRADNPALPHTPTEIAEETIAAHSAGAAVVHLHAREGDGTPSTDSELFRSSIELIRAGCDIITMVSTGGAVGMSVEERASGLSGGPEMAGIETGSINYGDEVFSTSPPETRALAEAMADLRVAPEVEIFEVSHIESATRFRAEGVLPEPLRLNLVLGVPGGLGASIQNLHAMAMAVPAETPWGVTVIGRHQRRLLAAAILFGATGVRVGFEDNVYLDKGLLAKSNAELVRQIASLAEDLGRSIADPRQAREILGLRVDQGVASR